VVAPQTPRRGPREPPPAGEMTMPPATASPNTSTTAWAIFREALPNPTTCTAPDSPYLRPATSTSPSTLLTYFNIRPVRVRHSQDLPQARLTSTPARTPSLIPASLVLNKHVYYTWTVKYVERWVQKSRKIQKATPRRSLEADEAYVTWLVSWRNSRLSSS